MLVFWRIRYLDTRDKQFKHRDLWLETNKLDPITRAAIEASHDLQDLSRARGMLRHRHLFREQKYSPAEWIEVSSRHGRIGSVSIHDYFEDENGDELTDKQIAVTLSGNPQAIMFPAGAKPYDIEYVLADKPPVLIDRISLSPHALDVLGYFTRDLREMLASAFFKEGPGTIGCFDGKNLALRTAITDEEIRSFVTIFRRFYLEKEPANFPKAAAVFANAIEGHPLADWIRGIAGDYTAELQRPPQYVPFLGQGQCPFTRKRLIDVFLYSQYAHQPDERRIRQFQECLAAVGNRRPLLDWLFLTEVWERALNVRNAGVIIAGFYDRYSQCHQVSGSVVHSIASDNAGIGALEKKDARETRVLNEKAEQLATSIWAGKGCPEGGPMQFLREAREHLKAALGHDNTSGDVAPRE